MPDLIVFAASEMASLGGMSSCDKKQTLLRENERLREKVAEIVLQLDALWKQFDPTDLCGQQSPEFCISTFHRDN